MLQLRLCAWFAGFYSFVFPPFFYDISRCCCVFFAWIPCFFSRFPLVLSHGILRLFPAFPAAAPASFLPLPLLVFFPAVLLSCTACFPSPQFSFPFCFCSSSSQKMQKRTRHFRHALLLSALFYSQTSSSAFAHSAHSSRFCSNSHSRS